MKRFFTPLLCFLIIFAFCFFLLSRCKSDPELTDLSWILSAENQKVSLSDYKEAFEIAQLPYTGHMLKSEALRRVLHQRVLNDLSEELLLRAAAEREGIRVEQAEIDEAIDEVRNAYSEEDFREMLAESVISPEVWERSMRKRVVIRKITEKILERDVDISVDALKKAYLDYCRVLGKEVSEVPYTEDLADLLVLRLRMQHGDEVYNAWLEENRDQIRIEVNLPLLHEVFPVTSALAVRDNGEVYNMEAAEAAPND